MDSPIFLSLDLGTTGIRCMAFDHKFQVLSSAYSEYPLSFGNQNEIEQNAELWFSLSKKVIREAVSSIEGEKSLIIGLSISSQGISIVPTDQNFKPLRPAISWLDRRGEAYYEYVNSKIPLEKLTHLTGKPWSGVYTLSKLIWLQENQPEIFHSTAYFLLPMDFIIARMTGQAITDHTMASGTMYYNIHSETWDDQILQTFHIPIAKLPVIQNASTGPLKILPEVLDEIGLSSQVGLFVGGQDQKCAAYAAGLSTDRISLSMGTSAAIEVLFEKPFVGVNSQLASFRYLFPNQWVSEAVVNVAGAALRWLQSTVFPDSTYQEIDRRVESVYPSENNVFFLPGLDRSSSVISLDRNNDKQHWQAEPGGVFWGMNFNTKSDDLACAVLESVAFEINSCLFQLKESVPNLNIKTIQFFGGGARSKIWSQIIADVTGAEVEILSKNEMAAAGAAMLVARGSAYLTNDSKLINSVDYKVKPNFLIHAAMEKKYHTYLQIRETLYA